MGLVLTIILVLLILGLLSGPIRGVSYGRGVNVGGLLVILLLVVAVFALAGEL